MNSAVVQQEKRFVDVFRPGHTDGSSKERAEHADV